MAPLLAEKGFQKATSANLPRVDMMMAFSFTYSNQKFMGAELKGVKNARASRESYGDDAVGYVQICRSAEECTVKARVTPEHKNNAPCYKVTITVNETEEKVTHASCEDCPAAAGGCKHALALLMWVHRRSEEPAPTSVDCYWKKSKLSTVGTSLKFVKAVDLVTSKATGSSSRPTRPTLIKDGATTFLMKVLERERKAKSESTLLKHHEETQAHHYLSLSTLCFWFKNGGGKEAKEFLTFCANFMTDDRCKLAQEDTVSQSGTSIWHKLRFGRVTASKIHEAARCQTADGSLTEAILGAKIPDSSAMKRGRDLEEEVLRVVERKVGKSFKKVGLFLNARLPVIGASPDAICDDFVVEVKCPTSEKTKKSYVINGELTPKCRGQIHLQMFMAGKRGGLFCVAHPDFETNSEVEVIQVSLDQSYVDQVVKDAMYFWEYAIFPKLMA